MKQIFVFFSCFMLFVSQAQEVKFLDKASNKPIVGVTVHNNTKTINLISDADGKVSLNSFTDNETITFQHILYAELTFTKLSAPQLIFLTKKVQDLEEIVISASKFEQNKREVPKKL